MRISENPHRLIHESTLREYFGVAYELTDMICPPAAESWRGTIPGNIA